MVTQCKQSVDLISALISTLLVLYIQPSLVLILQSINVVRYIDAFLCIFAGCYWQCTYNVWFTLHYAIGFLRRVCPFIYNSMYDCSHVCRRQRNACSSVTNILLPVYMSCLLSISLVGIPDTLTVRYSIIFIRLSWFPDYLMSILLPYIRRVFVYQYLVPFIETILLHGIALTM